MPQIADDRFKNALSRDFGEGGYTFLHRVFRTHFEGHRRPTIINTGDMYLAYSWSPGNTTFLDGIRVLKGESQSETFQSFSEVAGSFRISQAFKEASLSVPDK